MLPVCPRTSTATAVVLFIVAIAWDGARGAAESTRVARAPLPPDLPVREVALGERYRAGSFHTFFLGDEYRALWTAPIQVPVLDLRRVAGGLEVERASGGKETRGLVLKGKDGREYRFRSIDKDPTDILPKEYRDTFVDRIVQDQIAATFPGGTLAVSPLLGAAGVLHAEPVLVMLPDDPLLGEFREKYAGLVGTLEEHAEANDDAPHTFGAIDIQSGEKMWEEMDEDAADQPDAPAFLRARLIDILVGDFDRHRDQWRWAKMPGEAKWQPVPEDRDQAFIRFQGVIPGLAHVHAKRFVSFDETYPHAQDITFNGRDNDRRILVDLERPAWEEITKDVQRRITNDVIAEAVKALPAPYRAIEGANLETRLRSRRDQLPAIADELYRLLARRVDLRGTKRDDVVTIDRRDNGDVAVAIALRGEDAPYRQRVFHPDETEEVRVYLLDGADSVVTAGSTKKITVRVIGDKGDDVFDDRAGARLHVYDSSGENTVLSGKGTTLSTSAYTPPKRDTAEWIPPRDWGGSRSFFPFIAGDSDVGVLLVGGFRSRAYGFRKDPWAREQTLRVQYGTKPNEWAADYKGEFRRERSTRITRLTASASSIDFLHFYGFGNESSAEGAASRYDADVTRYVIEPALAWSLGGESYFTVSARGKLTHSTPGSNLLTETSPYGAGDFFQFGPVLTAIWDHRDANTTPLRGFKAQLAAAIFPPLASVESTFGDVNGEVSFSQPVFSALTVAARGGGKHVLGDTPYHEAAYIGGVETLRGFPSQRFAGDSALYGSAELRVPLTPGDFLPKGSVGLFGLYDVGRVFLDGESSDRWHSAAGGGLWITRPGTGSAFSFSVADGDEGTRYYLQSRLWF